MTRILKGVALALAMGLFVSRAAALEPVTATIDTVSSTNTFSGIDISSSVPTSVVVSTSPLYRQVCVQNISTSVYLACGERVNVSTITTSSRIGVILPAATAITTPYAPTCFSISAGTDFYCLHDAALLGTSRAVIIRGR